MPQSPLGRALLKVGRAWPPDILRPRLQYGNYLVGLANSKELESSLTPKLIRSQRRLLDNSLKEKYALSDKTLYPASYPDKYERLVGLLEEAVQSTEGKVKEKRGIWSRLFR